MIIPVMLGCKDTARLSLRHCNRLLNSSSIRMEIWYPGEQEPVRTQEDVRNDTLTFPVELKRGCAGLFIFRFASAQNLWQPENVRNKTSPQPLSFEKQ
jgi:hypothetical protein